jgi:anti-sigma factor (TIGR02949 family)
MPARCNEFVADVVSQDQAHSTPDVIGERRADGQGEDGLSTQFQRLAAPSREPVLAGTAATWDGAEDLVQEGDDQMSDSQRLIPCSDAVRQLWEYLDHEVSPEDQQKIDRHLSFCRTCCGELEFAAELRQFLISQGWTSSPRMSRRGWSAS